MRLLSLRLQNFRQHADTRVTFDRGLTGIIGPNGSGKSTLLEAIAWALYGMQAARGTRDSIRNARAESRAPVKVELEFELAGHRYRVTRGLTGAECFLDGGTAPIASTITGVSELLQRRLGMTRAEFFHTYFTEQKELDVMASLGAAERARFLSRVLGYDRLTSAQELVKDHRRVINSEATGVRKGLVDAPRVRQQHADAQQRVASTRQQTRLLNAHRDAAAATLAELTPRWVAAEAEREQAAVQQAAIALAEATVVSRTHDLAQIDRALGEIEIAHQERAPLLAALVPLASVREALAAQDVLAAAEGRRQGLLERLRGHEADLVRLTERLEKLASAPSLEAPAQAQLTTAREALSALEHALDEARTAWARDRQEAETRLETLRAQFSELSSQQQTMQGLGANSPCPTCGRPLGASYTTVLDELTAQVDIVRTDGNYYRQRVEQLTRLPEKVVAMDEQRRSAQGELTTLERRLVRIQEAIRERLGLLEQDGALRSRRDEAAQALAALPAGYDPQEHTRLRQAAAQLVTLDTQIARLDGVLLREATLRAERTRTAEALTAAREHVATVAASSAATLLADADYAALRAAHVAARDEAHRTEVEAARAVRDAEHATADLASATTALETLTTLEASLATLDRDRLLHEELDRAFGELRTDLNVQLRPELAEIASRFLDVLTDGRYNALEFDEEYNLVVLEDGLPKPVISGGEEDLCNLVLRLAISQMIAERAGQAFSLLILDEVFGSLDDVRRGNVVELLRRINDRFEQVIVITHIEQVREGLDRVLVVRFDEERGTSVVTEGTAGMAGRSSDDGFLANEDDESADLMGVG